MKLLFASVALATSFTTLPSAVASSCSDKPTIVEAAAGNEAFATLVAAVKAGGLVDALSGEGPFTVFAPTNDAFAKLPAGTVESLLKPENKDKLVAILTYHVVSGRVAAKDVVSLTGATTLNGQRIDIAVNDRTVHIDSATVKTTDIECSNGLIHVIDQVILPASDDLLTTAGKAGTFNTLAAAIGAAGLADALSGPGPFTVFAPTDEAFAKLPAGTVETLLKPENKDKLIAILKYHVVSGRVYSDAAAGLDSASTLLGKELTFSSNQHGLQVNSAQIVGADLDTSNGVIHVIDTVLLPKDAVGA